MITRRTIIRELPNPHSAAEIQRRALEEPGGLGNIYAERIVAGLETRYAARTTADVLAYVCKRIEDFAADLEPENAQSIGHTRVQRSIGRVSALEEVRDWLAPEVADEVREPDGIDLWKAHRDADELILRRIDGDR